MFNWRASTKDPTDAASLQRLDNFLSSITRIEERTRMNMVLDFCRDQEVLDIGAGEHDVALYSEESWEHGRIRRVAKRVVAAEIDPELCAHYRGMGFDFRCVDATSEVDLGDRFDRVFAGDVIEHVNDPVALMRFAKRHLRPGGRLLVTTPIPFAQRLRRHRSKSGARYVMANLEHTRWISISNMYEIALRSGLELTALHWPILKKEKHGIARSIELATKRARLSVSSLEEVFTEYAFELAASGNAQTVPHCSVRTVNSAS